MLLPQIFTYYSSSNASTKDTFGSLSLESQYLEELNFIDKSEVDRIHYLNDKIEKCRGISAGLMAIVLDYKEDSDFLM